ncbi:MAG: glycine zipper 2TM domain-containing protein [Zoogloeaceae bacterium]|nr:glycine zipper 2TM domain-containing protein [Zoogloeaceae bacterium]
MNTSMIKGVVLGSAIALAVGAAGITGYQTMTKPKFAEVLAAKEITETVKTPREDCQEVEVKKQAPVKDEHRIAGTAIGAVAGGLLGSTIGRGSGKTVATVAGAAAGGYAGNKVQQNMQEKDTVTTTETRCKTVYDTSKKSLGYDVSYRLDGKEGLVRMAFNPGTQIPVKDGQLVLEKTEAKK